MYKWFIVLIFWLASAITHANSAGPPVFPLNEPAFHLAGFIDYHEDFSKTLTLDDILAVPAEQWTRSNAVSVNRGGSDSIIWIHFRVDGNRFDPARTWQIMINNPLLLNVDFYFRTQGDEWNLRQSGSKVRFSERPVADPFFIFDLPVSPNKVNDYYLRVNAGGAALVPIALLPQDTRQNWSNSRVIITALYYGAMCIMALFFFVLALGTRNKIYGLHTSYIVSILLFNMTIDGFFTQYLWPGEYNITTFADFFAYLTIICGTVFSCEVMRASSRIPRLYRFMMSCVWMAAIFLLIGPKIDPLLNMEITIGLTAIVSFTIVIATLRVYFKGHREIRFFTIAWIIFLFFTISTALTYDSYMPWTPLAPYYTHIGSIIETVIISFSLADQLNFFRNERLAAEHEAKLQLEIVNQQLSKSNQLKDQFLSTVSHELRTPMNGVVGGLELINYDELPDITKQNFKTVTQSATEMMRVVDDLLEFSDLLSNQQVSGKKVFSIQKLHDYVIKKFKAKSVFKGISLQINCSDSIDDPLEGDYDKIIIILFQLVDNALKFTDNGQVNICIRCRSTDNKSAELQIDVRDTGIGIEQDKMGSLYQAFRQADGSLRRKYGGLGIGLAICKKAVETLDGNIHIQSSPGKGTTVNVSLPLMLANVATKEKPAHINEQSSLSPGTNSKQALVVEDNPVNQKVLVGLLSKLDITTQIANNGQEGAELCKLNNFDIIFMDCQMPVMDGFESTRQIRQPNQPNSHTPIVAVTANVMDADRHHCLAAGMNDFLKKPVKLRDIESMLRLHVGN